MKKRVVYAASIFLLLFLIFGFSALLFRQPAYATAEESEIAPETLADSSAQPADPAADDASQNPCPGERGNAPGRTIAVRGQGVVQVKPDYVRVNFAVVETAGTASEAQTASSAAMEKVFALLEQKGVAKEDYQTTSVNVWPQTRWNEKLEISETYGYEMSNTITVTIRDIENAGSIIAAAIDAGANRIDSVSYEVETSNTAYNEALRTAIARAKEKAQLMAEAAGVSLEEKPLNISENTAASFAYLSNYSYGNKEAAADMVAAAGASVPMSASNVEVTAYVEIIYATK